MKKSIMVPAAIALTASAVAGKNIATKVQKYLRCNVMMAKGLTISEAAALIANPPCLHAQ